MARGFVNVNRFKHGRALKRNSKRHTELQSKREMTRRKAKFYGEDKSARRTEKEAGCTQSHNPVKARTCLSLITL